MAKMNISEFKSTLGGGVKPNLFEIQIDGGSIDRRATILIKAASLPQVTLGKADAHHLGRIVPIPGDRSFGEGWQITVYNDENMGVYKSFLNWSNSINHFTNNIGDIDNTATVTVTQLNRSGNSIHKFKLNGAWPTEIPQIDLNMETRDAISEFQCTLIYLDYSIV